MDGAFKVHFDAQHRLSIDRLAGLVDTKMIEQLLAQTQLLEQSDPTPFNRLLDLTDVIELHLNGPQVLALSKSRRAATAHRPRVRVAIVAPNPLANGLARVYETLMEGSQEEVVVFWDSRMAADWLGVPDEIGR